MFSAAAEDFLTWQKRMPIEFSGYPADAGTLTNFPALVILSNTAAGVGFDYADFLSPPWDDLRFAAADKTTPLDFEVESWNPAGLSYVWVRIPELTNNAVIHALWRRGGVIAPPCTNNGSVWSNGFAGVWHLAETSGPAMDSTSNGNNGVLSPAGVTRGTAGPVDGNYTFSKPSSGHLTCGTNASLNVGHATWEAWAYPTSFSEYFNILGKGYSAAYWFGFMQSTGKIRLHCGGPAHDSASACTLNRWVHIMSTWDGKHVRHYINGRQDIAIAETSAPKYNPTKNTHIAADYSDGTGSSAAKTYYFPGPLDEVRLSAVPRASNWVWACYMNMASNSVFNSYGAPELGGGPVVTNLGSVSENELMTLNGYLLSTGMDANVSAIVFWGTNDAGQQADGWTYTNPISGVAAEGPLSMDVTPEKVGALYYFRFFASNSFGQAWANPAHGFIWWAEIRTGSVFSTW
ncbi:MAG: hypothetical protein GX608_12710 [Lentisphaerae bacterium]|nr:hypothetical protein [Lentisphaerota bacterium]